MTPLGLARLKGDEALRLHAYPDPLSHGEPWTIGWGCTGAGIGPHTVWTLAQAEAALDLRVAGFAADLARHLSWYGHLSPVRRDVLINLAFNLGVAELLTWRVTLANVCAARWTRAAGDLTGNMTWVREVGLGRPARLAAALIADAWPQPASTNHAAPRAA